MTTQDAPPTSITVSLSWNDTRFILEALQMMHDKWLEINRTTTNEDEQADYGNDLMSLRGTLDSLQRQAVSTFGTDVLNLSREPYL
jgi:hypothetical protein